MSCSDFEGEGIECGFQQSDIAGSGRVDPEFKRSAGRGGRRGNRTDFLWMIAWMIEEKNIISPRNRYRNRYRDRLWLSEPCFYTDSDSDTEENCHCRYLPAQVQAWSGNPERCCFRHPPGSCGQATGWQYSRQKLEPVYSSLRYIPATRDTQGTPSIWTLYALLREQGEEESWVIV